VIPHLLSPSVSARRSVIVQGAVIVGALAVYVMKPGWPGSVRHFSWLWWCVPILALLLTMLLVRLKGHRLAKRLALSSLILAAYFFIEGAIGTIVEIGIRNRWNLLWDDGMAGLGFIGLVDLVANVSTIITFIVLQTAAYLILVRGHHA
jgi:hypothetical protein